MTTELLHGDNVQHMRELHARDRRFALVYMDPPFFSQKAYETTDGEHAFDDRWPALHVYLDTLQAQLYAARDLLVREGSLVVHVDPTVSHYVRVRGDEVFGFDYFANEIVWRYRRWPTPTRHFQWMHDVLLRWVIDPECSRWNQLYEPLSQKTIETWANRAQDARFDRSGKRRRSVATPEESPGAALSDVWDIGILASGRANGSERTGYPTQKPEALLARLIDATTNPGDWVLDPFCGSGTTLAVCAKRDRNAVGIDASPVAIRYTQERIAAIEAQPRLLAPEAVSTPDPPRQREIWETTNAD